MIEYSCSLLSHEFGGVQFLIENGTGKNKTVVGIASCCQMSKNSTRPNALFSGKDSPLVRNAEVS